MLDGYFTDPNNITASLAHDFNAGYFRRLSDYTPDEINLRLSTYYKFLFSRHPFERLAAAFRNKFVYKNNKNKFFSYIFGQFIVRKYRNQNSTTSRSSPVTFSEFSQYIIDSPLEDKEFWNEHWERIDRLCLPCLIQYDFLGKFETLKQDAESSCCAHLMLSILSNSRTLIRDMIRLVLIWKNCSIRYRKKWWRSYMIYIKWISWCLDIKIILSRKFVWASVRCRFSFHIFVNLYFYCICSWSGFCCHRRWRVISMNINQNLYFNKQKKTSSWV